MNAHLIYVITLVLSLLFIAYLQMKFGLLKDNSSNAVKPYSLARTQLIWWTWLILSAIIAIICASGDIPDLDQSTLILLGIGSATTVSARLIDISDYQNAQNAQTTAQNTTSATTGNTTTTTTTTTTSTPTLSRDMGSEGFFVDILSDKNGISVHRLQIVAFNAVFGLWFIYKTFMNIKGLNTQATDVDTIIPIFNTNNLILLGVSAGTYAALKATENKPVQNNGGTQTQVTSQVTNTTTTIAPDNNGGQ